jgi:hypothetical protein
MSKPAYGPVIARVAPSDLKMTSPRRFLMLYKITYANGAIDTVDLEPLDAFDAAPIRHQPEGIPDRNRVQVDYGEGAMPEPTTNFRPAKRLPQVGEVWRNRGGALVAVMTAATILDGGFNVVTLSRSDTARNPGHVYLVDLDGHVHRDHSGAPGDLVTPVTRFDS